MPFLRSGDNPPRNQEPIHPSQTDLRRALIKWRRISKEESGGVCLLSSAANHWEFGAVAQAMYFWRLNFFVHRVCSRVELIFKSKQLKGLLTHWSLCALGLGDDPDAKNPIKRIIRVSKQPPPTIVEAELQSGRILHLTMPMVRSSTAALKALHLHEEQLSFNGDSRNRERRTDRAIANMTSRAAQVRMTASSKFPNRLRNKTRSPISISQHPEGHTQVDLTSPNGKGSEMITPAQDTQETTESPGRDLDKREGASGDKSPRISPDKSSPANSQALSSAQQHLQAQVEILRQSGTVASENKRQENPSWHDQLRDRLMPSANGSAQHKTSPPYAPTNIETLVADAQLNSNQTASAEMAGLRDQLQLVQQQLQAFIASSTRPQPAFSFTAEIDPLIDKAVTIKFEDHIIPQQLSKPCLRSSCSAIIPPGATFCASCRAPADLLNFRCHDIKCNALLSGSIEDILSMNECPYCLEPFPYADHLDQYQSNKIIQARKAISQRFDSEPPAGITVNPEHKVSWVDDTITILIRAGNSSHNTIVAPAALSVKAIWDGINTTSVLDPDNKVLGFSVDFQITPRCTLGALKGFVFTAEAATATAEWDVSPAEMQPRASSTKQNRVSFTKATLGRPKNNWDFRSDEAPLLAERSFKLLTNLAKAVLSDSFAQEHAELCFVLMAAHYSEAEHGKHVHFSIPAIMKIHAEAIKWWRAAMKAYIKKSSFLFEHFGDSLLWSHIGTTAQRVKLYVRSFCGGTGKWTNHIDTVFFKPAMRAAQSQLLAIAEASDTSTVPTPMPKVPPTPEELHQNDTKLTMMSFRRHNYNRANSGQPPLWLNDQGQWAAINLTACPLCLRNKCTNCTGTHADAVVSKDGIPYWDFHICKELVTKPESEWGAFYKQACIDKAAKLRARQASALDQDNGSLSSEATKIQAYKSEAALPDPLIRQPHLSEHKARYTMSEPKPASGIRLPKSEFVTQEVIEAKVIFPRLSDEGQIEVPLQLHCLGMSLHTSSGVQVQRCTFLTLASGIDDSAASLFEEQLESSVAFLDNRKEISEGYEEIAAAEELNNYMSQASRCHTRIFNRNQMSSVFHLKTAFPKLFKDKAVLVTYFEQSNLSVTYQLMLLASPSEQSKLSSEVIHIAAYQNHSYAVNWSIDLSTVERTLHFLTKANRFSDVAINLCVRIEDTLAGRKPMELDYLEGAKMYIAGLDGIPNSLKEEAGTSSSESRDLTTHGMFTIWTCSDEVAAPITYLCPANSTPDSILQEHIINTATHPAVSDARQRLVEEISKSTGTHMGISRLTANLAKLSTTVSTQQAVRATCLATSNVMLASKACYTNLISEYRDSSQQAMHLPWLLNSAHKHFATPIRSPYATSVVRPEEIAFNNILAANKASELVEYELEAFTQEATITVRTLEIWLSNHHIPLITGAWQQLHSKLAIRNEVDQRLRTIADYFIMTNIDAMASAIKQLESNRAANMKKAITPNDLGPLWCQCIMHCNNPLQYDLEIQEGICFDCSGGGCWGCGGGCDGNGCQWSDGEHSDTLLRRVWKTLAPVKEESQSQIVGYTFNITTGLSMFYNVAVTVVDIDDIPPHLHARSLLPRPKPVNILSQTTRPTAQTVITLVVVQASGQVTLVMADVSDTLLVALQSAADSGELKEDSTSIQDCKAFKVSFLHSSDHSTPPVMSQVNLRSLIHTEGVADFETLLLINSNTKATTSRDDAKSLNQIWDQQAGHLYAECERHMAASPGEAHSQTEPASQQSEDWSPIAARQVDESMHPLERYKQARARAENIRNTEQHCDWVQRMHHRQVKDNSVKGPSPRRSSRKATQTDRLALSASQPMVDDSSASDSELQWALEQQGPPKLIQHRAQIPLACNGTQQALADGSLPSSSEIAKSASTRRRQMKITDMKKVTYIKKAANQQPNASQPQPSSATSSPKKIQRTKKAKQKHRLIKQSEKLRAIQAALDSQPTSGAVAEHDTPDTFKPHSDFQNDLDKSQN